MYVEILKELGAYLLCAVVAFISAKIGSKTKQAKTLSAEDKKAKLASIKEKADKKYNCYVDKQLKKNKIENVLIETSNLDETEV